MTYPDDRVTAAGHGEAPTAEPAAALMPAVGVSPPTTPGPRWPRTRVVFVAAVAVLVFGVAATWLIQPSPEAGFVVSAHTATLTLEPLCGERLVWDLPPGRVVRRSALPGPNTGDASIAREDSVTLVLLAGSRVRLESIRAGTLRLLEGRADNIIRACSTEGTPFYELTVNGQRLDDPIGFSYSASRPADTGRSQMSLLLSGHAVLGDTIQHGAGWDTQAAILESGSVELRVVPWFGDNRVTLRTEKLEEGSLFDTHACLGAGARLDRREGCPRSTAKPAVGFLRTLPDGGMSVQLYVRGAVGTQSFGGDQRVLEISESTVAWHSPVLTTIASLFLIVFALYQGVKTIAKDSIGWWGGDRSAPSHEDEHDQVAAEAAQAAIERTREDKKHQVVEAPRTGAATLRTIAALATALAATSAAAEPVEIRQGSYVGAGYSFRRGASCLVVTARHVAPDMGVAITVVDRAGAKAQGSRSYDNEFYDLALIALPDHSPVACTSLWPESAWIARASFTAADEFRVVRHYPNGRETVVRLQHAGGIRHLLTLAPADRLTIRESDSGAMVEVGGRPVGLVQSVDTATDRVNVLRFDTIDQLVGDRFRRVAASAPLRYAGVFQRGRQNPAWSTYIQSWLTEKAGRTVIVVEQPAVRPDPRRPPTPALPANAARSGCEVKVDVMAWEHLSVPNPDYSRVELGLEACRKRGVVFEQLCATARRSATSTPRRVSSQKLTFHVAVTPPEAPARTKLETSTVTPPSGAALGRTELELTVLQEAVGPTLKGLLDSAPCQ